MKASRRSPLWSRRLHSAVSVLALFTAGCDGDDDDHHGHETHESGAVDPCEGIEPFMIGATAEGEHVRVMILDAVPSQPIRGDNAWTASLTDRSGAPLENADVDVVPWMPDHGHGTSVGAEITDRGEGEIHADPVNLWMAGLWEVRYRVTLEDGTTDTAVIEACVE